MKERNNLIFTIGVDEYQSDFWTNLNNAVFDCKTLLDTLKLKYSFEEYPNSLFDDQATKKNIYRELTTLRNFVNEDDNLIIFFAGHGVMNPHTKRGYLIPHEGTYDPDTWIENSVLKDYIHDINCKHIWLILDSCFSGAFLTNTRGYTGQKLYLELDEKVSRWVLTSGREEKVSDGAIGEHSPFARALLSFLDNNDNKYSCISEVVHYVRVLTVNTSKQIPQSNYISNIGHQDGELILTLKPEFCKTEKKSTTGFSSSPKIIKKLNEYNNIDAKIASGKELLLVRSKNENGDLMILENFRFDDHGNKKLTFKDGYVFFSPDLSFKLVQRFATFQGLERFLKSNQAILEREKPIPTIYASDDIELVENTLSAKAHSNYLQSLLNHDSHNMKCLHCNEKISTNDGYLIEIDEIGLIEHIGSVHKECLRPCDRIIGTSYYKGLIDSNLRNFNFELWMDLLKTGQGQIAPILKNTQLNKTMTLLWVDENDVNIGRYCIREYYDNGEIRYLKRGKDIERFSENEIDQILEHLNQHSLEKDRESYNPTAMISETKLNGDLEYLKRIKTENQTITTVTKYEKCLYSKQLSDEVYNIIKHDYAPLIILRDINSGLIFCIKNIIPIISDVTNIQSFIENWKPIVGDLDKYSLEILESDKDVNKTLMMAFKNGLQPILNPIFSDNYNINSGIIIAERDVFLSNLGGLEDNNNEDFKKGDIVKLVFPEMEGHDSFPLGKLLTDIFDENGNKYAIFQPIENGILLEEQQYKIPLSIIKEI